MKVAIIGAGSIGNHLAYSSRKLNWDITVFDHDIEALDRFKNEIFPSRYGQFDNQIKLRVSEHFGSAKPRDFDAILIGTPPDSHLEILQMAVKLFPRAIFVEKPFCPPSESDIYDSKRIIENNPDIKFFCGYNHRQSMVTKHLIESIQLMDAVVTNLEVKWLESWEGILRAHPWISGPGETYLGSTSRGGGALFEHSHGLDLWIQISNILGLGVPLEVKAEMKYIEDVKMGTHYDASSTIEILTENGFHGKVHQDVLANPSQKTISVLSKSYRFDAEFGNKNLDKLSCVPTNDSIGGFSLEIEKPRPFDFDIELACISNILFSKQVKKPILNLDALSGLFTAYVAKKAIDSSKSGKSVRIESKGWESLKNA